MDRTGVTVLSDPFDVLRLENDRDDSDPEDSSD